MQSQKTNQTVVLTPQERQAVRRRAEAREVKIEVEGDLLRLPHGFFISERNRIKREREKAHLDVLREARKKRRKMVAASRAKNRRAA